MVERSRARARAPRDPVVSQSHAGAELQLDWNGPGRSPANPPLEVELLPPRSTCCEIMATVTLIRSDPIRVSAHCGLRRSAVRDRASMRENDPQLERDRFEVGGRVREEAEQSPRG